MNNRRLKILVTAAGGDLGQAVIKCLALMTPKPHVLGCDCDASGVAGAFVDETFVAPRADDPGYGEWILRLSPDHGVSAVIPCSEAEIVRLASEQAMKTPESPALVCQPQTWLEVHGDKLRSFQTLEQSVPLADYADGSAPAEVEAFLSRAAFPCVIKPRRSCGSKSIVIATDADQVRRAVIAIPDSVVQEYIDDSDGEHSVGVFVGPDFSRAISFRRSLGPAGNSWEADNLEQDPEVLDYALAVAKGSRCSGACNVQVRKGTQGVRLLEVNPRFSSLVAARAACGFRDLEWAVRLAVGETLPVPPDTFSKIRFRRFFGEMIDTGNGFAAIDKWQPKIRSLG
jgi:carbamoyl-phosphate synthase large subunit